MTERVGGVEESVLRSGAVHLLATALAALTALLERSAPTTIAPAQVGNENTSTTENTAVTMNTTVTENTSAAAVISPVVDSNTGRAVSSDCITPNQCHSLLASQQQNLAEGK